MGRNSQFPLSLVHKLPVFMMPLPAEQRSIEYAVDCSTEYGKKQTLFEILSAIFWNSSASGNRMKENRARTNFPLSISTEGAPVYEQKELRKQRRMP